MSHKKSQDKKKGTAVKGKSAEHEDVPAEYKVQGPSTDLAIMVYLCSESKEYAILDAFLAVHLRHGDMHFVHKNTANFAKLNFNLIIYCNMSF